MAYIKIFGIKSTVKKAVDYITNPDKTDEQNLVSSYGCSPETADLEFVMTAKLGKDNVLEKGNNLAWHMIISFKPGEITDPHIAHEVLFLRLLVFSIKNRNHSFKCRRKKLIIFIPRTMTLHATSLLINSACIIHTF